MSKTNPLGGAAKVRPKTKRPRVVPLAAKTRPPSEGWEESRARTAAGKLRPTAGNVALILANDEKWRGTLGFNELGDRAEWLKRPPSVPGLSAPEVGPVADHDMAVAGQRIALDYEMAPSKEVVLSGAMKAARQNSFHPVRDHLSGLKWDSVPRIETWLSAFLNVEDSAFAREAGKRWLISAVARVFEPGCKADCMLVLEGPQGFYKSTALETLAVHKAWFRDHIEEFGSKDARLAVAGVWIVEAAELHALTSRKADVAAIKSFLSTNIDRYRPPYAHLEVEQPRAVVFAGTTNDDTWQNDTTGGRRFWPVKVRERIDIPRLAAVRDDLWAEAVELYGRGDPWWLVGEEALAEALEEQAARVPEDSWGEAISAFVYNWHDGRKDWTGLTTATILSDALGIEPSKQPGGAAKRVANYLRSISFEPHKPHRGPNWWVPTGLEWRHPVAGGGS